jgi:outer membrane protein assembly factor BamB
MKFLQNFTLLTAVILFSCNSKHTTLPWKYSTNGKIYANPIIIGETIYIGSMDSVFYALDKESGELIWSVRTNAPIQSTACANEKVVYFKSGNSTYALNQKDGAVIWSYIDTSMQQTGKMDPWDFHSGSPVIYKSLVYFGFQNGRLLGFNIENGNIENEIEYGDTVAIKSGLLIDGGILYFGGWNGKIYAYNLEKDTLEWIYKTYEQQAYPTFGQVNTQLVIDEDLLYFGSRNPEMQVIDLQTGKKAWSYIEPEGGWISGEALVKEGILYIGGSDNHEMFAFDASTGEKRWTFEFLNNNFSKPLIYKDYLLFTTGDAYNVYGKGNGRGYLYALNKDDGTIHQFEQIGGNLYSNILVENGVVYLGNEDGNIYALSLEHFLNDSLSPVEKGYNVLEDIELSPNPFSDSLAIRFRINREIELSVQIRNVADEPFRALSNGLRATGEYTLYWDGKDSKGNRVEQGYYFVELTAGLYAHKVLIQRQ